MELSEIEKILISAEEVVLDGGKTWTLEGGGTPKGEKAIADVAPKIIEAYKLAKSSGATELLGRIYHLARHIRKKVPHILGEYTEIGIEDQIVSERLRKIAMEGRSLSLAKPNQGKLYFHREGIFAAQIRDPRRGISASICSNCDEPVIFIDYKCRTCGYDLIDGKDMPTISEWNELSPAKKNEKLESGFIDMFERIKAEGDWRGSKSRLNRLRGVAFYSD